jgi:hypothetical protein
MKHFRSNLRAVVLAVALTGLGPALCLAQNAKTRIVNVIERGERGDLAAASEAEKTAMRGELRKYLSGEIGKGLYSNRAEEALVEVGDAETIQKHVDGFLHAATLRAASRAAKMLARASDPAIIARLADQMFVEESTNFVTEGGGEFFVSPKSILAADAIVKIAIKAVELPEPVRQSLKRVQKVLPDERRRVLRRWWNENRNAFASKSYDRVVPAK